MILNIQSSDNGKRRTKSPSLLHNASPVQQPPAQTAVVPPKQTEPAPDNRVNILLVDDTPENLIALEAVLCDLGQNIVKASSGEEALRCLLRTDFAAIILDVNMPGMNGFETATLIRQRKNSQFTPIIFVSAISTSEMHMYQGYALGAVDYIFTPVIPEVLRSKVAVFVELLKKNQEIQRQAEQLRIVEEKEHQRLLHEASERLDLETKRNRFFNLSIDMLGIADFKGYFKQLNPAWKNILGFSEKELKAKPFLHFIHPEDQADTRAQLDKLKRPPNASVSFETRCACNNGAYRWLSWSAALLKTEELVYICAKDITPRKEAEEKIQALNEDLERRAKELEAANHELEVEINARNQTEDALKETNAELEAFCYSVSHDLRAPLRAMQSFAEALLEDYGKSLDEMGQDFARRIVSAAGRMEGLIQDLLVYSRITHTELKLQSVDLEKAIQDSLNQLEAAILEKDASVTVHRPLHNLIGHHSTVVQVVCNLLSNAIKFVQPTAKPQVHIRMETNGKFGRLWIEDNGIGIAPEYQVRIFRVFERLHGIESFPGTGIGLAIVRKGLERMGGRVGLESVLDRGSKFWIELPLEHVNSQSIPCPN